MNRESDDFRDVSRDAVRGATQKESGVRLLHVLHDEGSVGQDLRLEATADAVIHGRRRICFVRSVDERN